MKLNTVEYKKIDRAEAARMLAAFEYERQRKVNVSYVKYYSHMMKQGEWLPGTEIDLAFAPLGNGMNQGYLVNGRHRLLAIIDSDAPQEFVVKAFDCCNKTEVGKLYGMIDTGKSRNVNDYLRAIDVEHEFGFTTTNNRALGSTVAFINAGCRTANRIDLTPEERLGLMRQYSVAASRYFDILAMDVAKGVNAKMKVTGVMSVALITLDQACGVYGDEKVERFWMGIAKNDGLRIGDPRKVAHGHIFDISIGSVAKYKKTSMPYTARYLALCFAAWVENREIKFTKVTDASAPISISGTSFRG